MKTKYPPMPRDPLTIEVEIEKLKHDFDRRHFNRRQVYSHEYRASLEYEWSELNKQVGLLMNELKLREDWYKSLGVAS